ncbi:MAG: GvpL/GvpF family gas vesicle protein [Pseudomonadota bacterium]
MSAVMLHGVAPAGIPHPRDAIPHRRVALGALSALVTPLSAASSETEVETAQIDGAMDHHQLLTSYCRIGDVLPVRYGTAFSSERELAQELSSAQAPLTAGMKRLEGCVEYSLAFVARALDGPETSAVPEKTPSRGRTYIQGRRERRDWRRSLAEARADFVADVVGRVSLLGRDAEWVEGTSGRALAKGTLLIERTNAKSMQDLLCASAAKASSLALTIRVVGPGPCYSFAKADLR